MDDSIRILYTFTTAFLTSTITSTRIHMVDHQEHFTLHSMVLLINCHTYIDVIYMVSDENVNCHITPIHFFLFQTSSEITRNFYGIRCACWVSHFPLTQFTRFVVWVKMRQIGQIGIRVITHKWEALEAKKETWRERFSQKVKEISRKKEIDKEKTEISLLT